MRVLIACETSGVMRRAFAARVEGFPDYEITVDGVVISYQSGEPRALNPAADGKGYLGLTLCNGPSVRRRVRVHRLVAETFIPNDKKLPCVRHLDGDPKNNRVENLAWGTYEDNENDKHHHGTWELRRIGKLTERDRNIARRLAAASVPQRVIADALGVSRPTITRLVNRTIWGNDQ